MKKIKQYNAYKFSKSWIAFNQMMSYFKTKKTGIYIHPDFVMIDHDTWRKLQGKAKPKQIIYYDEASSIPEQGLLSRQEK